MNQEAEVQALDVDYRDRFIMIYDDVWQVLKGGTSLSVYMALKRRVNPDRKYWYGTHNSLSEEAGVSPKTFRRCIEELEGIGLVVSTRRFAPKGWDRKDNSKIIYGDKPGKGYEEIGKLYQIRFHMPSDKAGQNPLGKSDQTPLGLGKSDQRGLGKSDQRGRGKSDHQTYNPLDINTQDGKKGVKASAKVQDARAREVGLKKEKLNETAESGAATPRPSPRRAIHECGICDHNGRRLALNFRTGRSFEVKCNHTPDDAAAAELSAAIEEQGGQNV